MSVVSAPGKAFLIGEYAVLEGSPALVTAIDVRAVAYAPREALGERPGHSPVLDQALEVARAHLGGDAPPVVVDTGAFGLAGRKLGLGSSAAVTVSAIGRSFALAGKDLGDPNVVETILELAREAHRSAQGGGSGADVACSALGGTIVFRRGDERSRAEPVAWPEGLHVAFVDAGAPASTEALLGTLRAGAKRTPERYKSAMALLTDAAQRFIAQFSAPSIDAAAFSELCSCVAAHNQGLAVVAELAASEILTPSIKTIIDVARSAGLCAKPSGAGGGDLVVVFAPTRAALDRLGVRLWNEHGLSLLGSMAAGAPGVGPEDRPPLSARVPGFFREEPSKRRDVLCGLTGLAPETMARLDPDALDPEAAQHMIENVVGVMSLPVGIATNFCINGQDALVPMCVEEASVVAAASNAAKMVRDGGGFVAHNDPPWMIAQVQLVRPTPDEQQAAVHDLLPLIANREEHLLREADRAHPRLVARGGGARGVETRVLDDHNLVVHILVDCRDAMGANLINTVAEGAASQLEQITGWRANLRILSNLADRRCVHVTARVRLGALVGRLKEEGWSGADVADGIVSASRFAELDPYRAATHNKGIMNGVDAVILATGNDWRAVEAGAHAYAARSGQYAPLAVWRREQTSTIGPCLVGRMSIPMALGTVGGATRTHPTARHNLDILGNPSAGRLGAIVASVGLASNLAALRALATEGIQRGHMSLHAHSVALGAGAVGDEIPELARRLISVGEIKPERACTLLAEMRAQ